jgi:hypothetical protein
MLFAKLEHPEINNTFEDNIISTIESHRHLDSKGAGTKLWGTPP